MSVVVRPVSGWRDRREFVELPYRLHSTSEVWVPPLRLERHIFLMRSPERVLLARRRAAVPGVARRARRRADLAPSTTTTTTPTTHNRDGMFGFLEFEDAPDILPAMLEAAVDLAAGPRARPDDRPDGLLDERRVRRDDRGLRADAVHQAAVASAVLRGALRGGGAGQGRRPVHVRARDLGPLEDPPDRLQARGARSSRGTASRSGACPGARCGATWIASPRSTTRPGARTGASCPTARRTWTSTPRRCSSSSTATGTWSPRPRTATRPRSRSRSRTSTRC